MRELVDLVVHPELTRMSSGNGVWGRAPITVPLRKGARIFVGNGAEGLAIGTLTAIHPLTSETRLRKKTGIAAA